MDGIVLLMWQKVLEGFSGVYIVVNVQMDCRNNCEF